MLLNKDVTNILSGIILHCKMGRVMSLTEFEGPLTCLREDMFIKQLVYGFGAHWRGVSWR